MKSVRYRLLFMALSLALSISWAALVGAQEATPEATPDVEMETVEPEVTETPITDLSYNSPVVGRISNTTPMQEWPLQTTSADRITVVVERLDGNLIPSVAIVDASGQEISNSFGADATAAVAVIDAFTLPTLGSYDVRVTRDGGETGVTEGSYQLTVIPVATAADNINNTTVIGEVEVDTPVEGEITPAHWYHRYTYAAAATDTITIRATRTRGSLIPEVQILDANGNSIQTGFNAVTGDVAEIERLTLPNAGQYVIVVTRNSGFTGLTEGDYELVVELVGSGSGSPNLAGAAGAVEYDMPLAGEITNNRWYQDWTLSAEAADTLNIRVLRNEDETGANLQPTIIVLGGSGQEVTRGYTDATGDQSLIDRFTLQSAGTYSIRVSRQGDQTGATQGAYTLMVSLVGSGAGSPALEGASGGVALGETVEGEVTNARWADTWTFSGTQNQRIYIEVERTGGTLIPRVEIRDANGQTITSGFPEASRDRVVLDYTVPTNSPYQIVVLRDGGQTGATTGTYALTVSEPEA